MSLASQAEKAGWTPPEVLTAILAWTVTTMRQIAGDKATRTTLSSAIMMLDD